MGTSVFLILLFILSATGAVQQLSVTGTSKTPARVSQQLKDSASFYTDVLKRVQAADLKNPGYSRKLLRATSEDLLHFILVSDVAAVQALLKQGVDPNYLTERGQPLLFEAIRSSNRAIILGCIEYGADIDNGFIYTETNKKLPGLHAAAFFGYTTALEVFLDAGASMNELDADFGYSPLHFSALGKQVATAKLLLDRGATVDVRTRKKLFTPLHLAAEVPSNYQLIYHLLAKGADVNSRNSIEQTPLFVGVVSNSVTNVHALIREGADVNAEDDIPASAIHYASKFGSLGSLELLVENGAEISMPARALLCSCRLQIDADNYCNISDCKDPKKFLYMERLLE